ncbi:MAG TPA: FHA domain-containing protein [Isosphaeraceae bacterium]|jgi:pSer/pThr/pTyr-binding forkhead associated (FHA) protein|nr:FHA domain-containing protein [Isosphaeraceae bacterium]
MTLLPDHRYPTPAHPSTPPARPPAPARPGGLWAAGSFRLRLDDPAADPLELRVDRPYALIGRTPGADLRIDDRAVSGRHVYLHLDRRGLFVVDLATRTGTRLEGIDRPYGWLRPGEALEVAGRRVTLLDLEVLDAGGPADGPEAPADEPPPDLLADAASAPLVRVTLYPSRASSAPRTIGSELVVLGRGSCCGVQVEEASAARIHCILVRGPAAAYLVDLTGRGTSLNGLAVAGASALADGDTLTIGAAPYRVRIDPPGGPSLPAEGRAAAPPPWAWPPGPVPPEAQGTVLSWIMGLLQAHQGENLRKQDEFQANLIGVIQQIHHEQAVLLSRHLERMESINRELASLRDEIRQRLGPGPGEPSPPAALPFPKPPPLKINPTVPPPPADPGASTAWLLKRVQQLEEENRSTWRDLLGRLSGPTRKGS